MWNTVKGKIRTIGFRILFASSAIILSITIGGVVIFGIIYASAGAVGGLYWMAILIALQWPVYQLLKYMGCVPAVGLHRPLELEQDEIEKDVPNVDEWFENPATPNVPGTWP
ncbi:MAG: hypothetical protein JWM11_729 [Planctomycetaceae bacterium]|nr:hypothetical protein [Planctomycetaceae bacterium]